MARYQHLLIYRITYKLLQKMKRINSRAARLGAVSSFFISIVLLAYQNCARLNFSKPETVSDETSTSACALNSQAAGCAAVDALSCNFNGQVLQSGQSVIAYQLAAVAFDQQCQSEQRICNEGILSGAYVFAGCVKGSAPAAVVSPSSRVVPKGLSLVHTANYRTFTVNWTAGFDNGGPGSCRVEYRKNNGSWILLKSANCDANGALLGTLSLPNDGWYGGSWSNVEIRLVRSGDNLVIGSLGSLRCSSRTGSNVATPTIDENCNNQWNESSSASCEILAPDIDVKVPIGTSYSFSSITKSQISSRYQVTGNCASFASLAPSAEIPVAEVIWYKLSKRHGNDSTCSKIPEAYGGYYIPVTTAASGIVPSICGGTNSCVNTECFPNNSDGAGVDTNDYLKWETPGNFQDKYRIRYRHIGAIAYY